MPDLSEKKRKRNADKNDRPSKKVQIDQPTRPVKLSVLDDNYQLGPVVAATPGLSFPSELTLKPYKKDIEKRRYELLLQSSDHPKLDFTARQEEDGTADCLLKDYVGIYDPETGALQIMEAQKLVLRSTLRSEAEEMRVQREAAANRERQTNFALRQQLGKEFGTKKAKKALSSITENAINPTAGAAEGNITDAVAKAVLESVTEATADAPSREALQQAVDENKPRPKANLEAATPAEVYPPEVLIGGDSMRLIEVKSWLETAEKNEDIRTPSLFVAKRLQKTLSSKNTKKLKVLKYMLLLIDFLAALKPARNGAKKLPQRADLEKKTGTSGALLDGVRRKFADGNEMTKWHVDYLITHIAALSLYIDDFVVDTFDLREDLRLDNKQVGQYYHELGCKVTNPTEKEREAGKYTKAEAVNHKTAKLKIPLDFPKQRALPSRRR
ncbi:DNA-directed RNA polymerase [Lasiodiplodia theobromae]|uniref:DNA-directed RNA polymerase I subunit RPA49 n=1 Tax=Lasiodiplodia theobromae TaxID=45133 RepID=A0A5N5DJC2_9PEZI|nr:DNA-directed RNA polymerase [Lasiodiplodia theobromae]KAB2576994.1 DNA-directed RNA polymerase I subunit RPA49 [Lasiodiplodia theobromae]KAF4543606.1 DNA-directed RNA polymerase [Lasiodiplodia theobromae]